MAETAESVRQQGNERYRSGNYKAAAELYRKAVGLAPQDATPLSNLSIALFELGDYDACDEACNSALDLLAQEPQDNAVKQKIYARQIKACLAVSKIDAAQHTAAMLTDGPERDESIKLLALHSTNRAAIEDVKSLHTRLVLELPRYKPMMRKITEYYSYGHDTPEPLYTFDLLKTGRNKVSLMFGGIGDARNLHSTLLSIVAGESSRGKKSKTSAGQNGNDRLFHFTLVDIKPAAIARDLVVFLLLKDIADFGPDRDSVVKHKLFPCLYYTYLAPLMPRGVSDVLHKRIKALVEMLEGRQALPDFLDVPKLYRPDILRVLRQWQTEASNEYPASRMRKSTVSGRRQAELQEKMQMMQYAGFMPPPVSAPKGCEKEKRFYEATGLLPLTSNDYKLYRPEFRACIDNFDGASGRAGSEVVTKAGQIADDTWAPNVTFVDLDWQRTKPFENESYEIDVGHNVFDFADKMAELDLVPPRPRGLYDYLEMWFTAVAAAFGELQHRMKIEACVGDVTAVLEQIKYGVVGHREQSVQGNASVRESTGSSNAISTQPESLQDINEYPSAYDRIHLSNIPDYIGGNLSSFIYASPLTHTGKASYVTSTNLRNPPRFPTIASFDLEYTALGGPSDLTKVFQVSMKPLKDPNEEIPTCRYNKWHHHPGSKDVQDLMPRPKLETWLLRLFLKIAIPKDKKDVQSNTLIYSPLNLAVFFRLLKHLYEVGYPAHWLSGVWADILSGRITTSARPPRSEPLSITELRANVPAIEQSTAPFVAELTTLTALWQPTLPFAIPAANIAPLENVHRYSVQFSRVSSIAVNIPTFVLAIYDEDMPGNMITNFSGSVVSTLRQHLLDDEKGLPKTSAKARKIHDEALHLITTWDYNDTTRTATFWFRSDFLDKMQTGSSSSRLRIAIWRTDNYARQSSPQKIPQIHDHGVWIRGEDIPMPEHNAVSDNEEGCLHDDGAVESSDDDEDDDDDDEDDDEPGFRGIWPPTDNEGMDMFQQMLEQTMRAMPGDSAQQRMRLAEQLIGQGVSGMERERRR